MAEHHGWARGMVRAGEIPPADAARHLGRAARVARAALGGRRAAADRRDRVGRGRKSVLLADWAAARPPGTTSWLSCDRADADPVRFWSGFIEAPRTNEPGFGADAADLLAMDGRMSADVMASIANDAAKLPAGSAVIVDDFHYASTRDMTDLVERWPAGTVQLVLSSRSDPPLRQHRLRMSGDLCEIRDGDLYFSLAESRDLLAKLGAQLSDSDLACFTSAVRGGPRHCRWRRCRCAAPGTRHTSPGHWMSAIVRSPNTSSPRCSISSPPRWLGSCSTCPSWGPDRRRVRRGHRQAGRRGDAARPRCRPPVPRRTR